MCHSFKLIAEADVTAVFPVYEDIVQCLDDRESIVRGGAVWVLRWVAEEYPERVFDHIARVVELMEDEESWTRHGAAWAVAFLADADPDRVEPYVPAVIALLEGYVYREDEYKFSNAGPNELLFDAPIEVLRLVGRSQPEAVADAVPLLDEIASNDEYDQEIRTFAADTVEDIE
jgi:HEAT repeat protein